MNRLYILTVGSLEIRGLISSVELPDLVLMFYSASAERGAEAKYLANGIFIATKSEVTVKLEIQGPHPSIPCGMLQDRLEEIMEKAFQ